MGAKPAPAQTPSVKVKPKPLIPLGDAFGCGCWVYGIKDAPTFKKPCRTSADPQNASAWWDHIVSVQHDDKRALRCDCFTPQKLLRTGHRWAREKMPHALAARSIKKDQAGFGDASPQAPRAPENSPISHEDTQQLRILAVIHGFMASHEIFGIFLQANKSR